MHAALTGHICGHDSQVEKTNTSVNTKCWKAMQELRLENCTNTLENGKEVSYKVKHVRTSTPLPSISLLSIYPRQMKIGVQGNMNMCPNVPSSLFIIAPNGTPPKYQQTGDWINNELIQAIMQSSKTECLAKNTNTQAFRRCYFTSRVGKARVNYIRMVDSRLERSRL